MINITRLSFHLACDVMHFKTVHTRRAQQVTLEKIPDNFLHCQYSTMKERHLMRVLTFKPEKLTNAAKQKVHP